MAVVEHRTAHGRSDLLRKCLDHVDDLVTLVALAPGEVNQVPDPTENGAFLRCPGNGHASTPSEIEESLVSQDVKCPNDSVLVDPENGGEVFGEREAITGASFPLSDGSSNLGRYLIVKGK
jgi:hypothetical protein